MRSAVLAFAALLFIFLPDTAAAQCSADGTQMSESAIAVTGLADFPPMYIDMPFDCIKGYASYDSIARTKSREEILEHLHHTSIDSLRAEARLLYAMYDYSPLLFSRYLRAASGLRVPGPVYRSYPAYNQAGLIDVLANRRDEFGVDYAYLVESMYILKVRIIDVKTGTDSSTQAPWLNAACEVLVNYKGRSLPGNCPNGGNLLKFGYAQRRPAPAGKRPGRIWDALRTPQKGKEYFLFLTHTPINDSAIAVVAMESFESNGGIFPIDAGHVLDPNNIFGAGINPGVDDFENALVSRIAAIRTWSFY